MSQKGQIAEAQEMLDGVKARLRHKELPLRLTPLMLAAVRNSSESVNILLASGADVNEQDESGFTALMLAAVMNHADIVRLLIEHGADVNLKAHNGFTALMFAIFKDAIETVQVLTDANAEYGTSITPAVSAETLSFHDKLSFYISNFTLQGLGKPSVIYTKANMSKQTFSKIRSNMSANYHPRKNQVFKLAIGMKLTIAQTEDLLQSAGYAFGKTDAFDQIVRKHIDVDNYNIEEIEAALLDATGKQLS